MFGWDDAFLLSMQAAGAIYNISETKKNMDLVRMGRKLEQASIETNLEALRAQNAQSSATAMEELRENVSNQIVLNAARGVSSGAGSAAALIQKSESNFNSDEKVRRINLLTKESELRAANVLSGLHTLQSETELGQSLTNKIFNTVPVTSLASKFKVGKKVGSALESVGTGVGRKFGFGLNPIGS